MKRDRYLALAVALGAMGLIPAMVVDPAQAITPMDLEFQIYHSNHRPDRSGYLLSQTPGHPDVAGHEIRYKLTYLE